MSERKNSTEVLQSFFDAAPMMMGVVELVGDDILHVSDNAAAGEFFGLAPDVISGKLASELGTPNDITRHWIEHYRTAEATKKPVHFDYWHDTNGHRRYLSATVNFITKAKSGRSRFSYIVQDATALERRMAERMLELKYKTDALENSINGFNIINARGEIIYANRAYLKMWGYESLNQILRKPLADLCLESELPQTIINEVKTRGECNIEFEARRKDGRLINVVLWARQAFDAAGNEIYPMSSIDVTERRRAERELSRYVAQIEAVLQSVEEGIIVTDMNGNIIMVNDAEAEIYGFKTGTEMLREFDYFTKMFEFFTADKTPLPAEQWPLSKLLRGEPIKDVELRARRKDTGQELYLSFSGSIIRDSKGRPELAVFITRDITAHKKNTEALEEALRARDEFLSIASHELNTPLTSMKLQAQMRKRMLIRGDRRVFAEESVRRLIEDTDRQIKRLSRLVDDMLDVSRIATGNLTMRPETFDLCMCVRNVVDRLRPQFDSARVQIRLQQCQSAIVRWDLFRIEQALTNLLINALKYGHGKPVDIKTEKKDGKAIVQIIDRGPGIASEHQKRIFGRFERAISPSKVSGLGLGLFITRQIVEAHHGTIDVQNEAGKGAKFIIEIPLDPKMPLLNAAA